MENIIIHWFREDLRLLDNPSFYESCSQGKVIPLYIYDVNNPKQIGGASKWWLHHSLNSLQKSLNGNLCFFLGNPEEILLSLINKYQVQNVNWNRCYTPWRISNDTNIKANLLLKGVKVRTFNASLLWEPWDILKKDGTPYKVFTPYYKRGCLLNGVRPRPPIDIPNHINFFFKKNNYNNINDLKLLKNSNWSSKFADYWDVGEKASLSKLERFVSRGMIDYKEGRNYPGKKFVSQLSPYLHFGEISPHYIWHKINNFLPDNNTYHFLSELGWREFSYYLLYHFPYIVEKNLQSKFDKFEWHYNKKYLTSWQKGMTGYPIVDAGMRQLWEEGYMHNRVRMVVGSFLVKNLLLHWHLGEKWFWDCLVDADLASNSASWQWIAGCGADAAPFFRIFNPITQGEKFDCEGIYTKKYLPELSKIPNKYLFCPWQAPQNILEGAGICLGKDYPHPIIDLQTSRNLALDSYKKIKKV